MINGQWMVENNDNLHKKENKKYRGNTQSNTKKRIFKKKKMLNVKIREKRGKNLKKNPKIRFKMQKERVIKLSFIMII